MFLVIVRPLNHIFQGIGQLFAEWNPYHAFSVDDIISLKDISLLPNAINLIFLKNYDTIFRE